MRTHHHQHMVPMDSFNSINRTEQCRYTVNFAFPTEPELNGKQHTPKVVRSQVTRLVLGTHNQR